MLCKCHWMYVCHNKINGVDWHSLIASLVRHKITLPHNMACPFFKTFLVYVVTEKYMHGQPEVFWRLTEHRQRSPVVVRRLRRPR